MELIMKGVELLWLDFHLRSPHSSALGSEVGRPVVVARLETEAGGGWGECAALETPSYSEEYAEGAWEVLRKYLVPALLEAARQEWGRTPGPGGVQDLGGVRGHRMAKACLEMALLDADLRADGRSLAEAMEVSEFRAEAGAVLGLADPESGGSVREIVTETEQLLEQGYRRVKLKINPESGASVLGCLRDEFPDLGLQADANGSFDVQEPSHLRTLLELDSLGLICIEQPLDPEDLLGHAKLVQLVETPICLDESLTSVRRVMDAIEIGACDIVCVKPARLGGILQAVMVHDLCKQVGVPAWCGGMLETALARSANAAVSALPGFSLPGDITGGERFVEPDPFLAGSDKQVSLVAGPLIEVQRSPGVGPAPDEDLLRAVTTRREYLAV